MFIPRKTYTYFSTKFFYKYYHNEKFLSDKRRFFWERNSSVPIFLVNKVFWIHKGIHFRKKIFEYYHLSKPTGVFTINRKPFTPPIKKKDLKKKKRIGKI